MAAQEARRVGRGNDSNRHGGGLRSARSFTDDFADGQVFDAKPVSWSTPQELLCGDSCCHGAFQADTGDLLLRNTGSGNTFLLSTQRYEGDISLRAHSSIVL